MQEGEGVSKIENLRLAEGIQLDPDCLIAIYAELGQRNAERVLACAMEEMAIHIATMSRAAENNAPDHLVKAAEELAKIAGHVGMNALANVAQDVARCALAGDRVGLSATLNRLIRVGDRSLTAIWDGPDLTG
jgi:hypothetical protein